MLSEESREAAGRRWMRAFDALYDAPTLLTANTEALKVYAVDSEYTLQLVEENE